MTIPSEIGVAEMHALRQSGKSVQDIAAAAGLKAMTVYQRLRRAYGVHRSSDTLPGPANDNNPSRVTRMTARNGGCSTVSGLMPVTLARVPTVDGVAGMGVAA